MIRQLLTAIALTGAGVRLVSALALVGILGAVVSCIAFDDWRERKRRPASFLATVCAGTLGGMLVAMLGAIPVATWIYSAIPGVTVGGEVLPVGAMAAALPALFTGCVMGGRSVARAEPRL